MTSVGQGRRDVHRHSGGTAHRFASALLGASLTMVVALILAVAVGATGSSKAFAAGSARETLHGHQGIVPPGATLLGPAPSTTTLPLEVTLQPRDPSALAAEVQAVSNPRSPEYRHFLTPQQFAQRFGPTQATIAQVASALRSEGLTVGTPSSGALSLPVSGTVAQIQSAFSTPISRYRLASGKTGYDNRSAPEVPVTVAPQIEGVLGLDTLSPPQPTTTVPPASSSTSHPAATPAASPALAPGQPTPTGTSCTSSISGVESNYGALDADQLAQAYSFDPLYTANHYGAGSTVALVEMYGAGYRPSDISTFAACYGITNGGGQVTEKNLPNGGALGGNTVEAELDIETVLSLAPKANIEVYEGGPSDDLYDVFKQIVDDDTAKIISASWTNGCEAYVGQAYQNSENSLFQQAAAQGQSIFVATGDEGSEGCNTNGERTAATGTDPVTQAVDPSTGTLYIADKSSNTVTVDSEGSASNPTDFASASGPVPTGSGPDAVALDTADGKVFVANSGGSLTVIPTATCNTATNTDCSTPTPIAGNGHLSAPDALAVNGSTLYVGNSNGTVAVYDAASNTWVATVNLLASSVATALAVDATNGTMYIADASNNRVEYINIANCNATISTGCSVSPSTVTGTLGNDPVTMAVTAGDLYVGNAGAGGGISVVSLTTHGVVKTISTDESLVDNGIGLVQSVGLSPDGTKVLAIVTGLDFPGDVMATINPSTQAITATVALQDGTDSMGQLVSDGTRDYVWALDETNPGDIIQNLNLAATDPASQPYVTAVGGTSVTAVGPAPTETVWNDQLHFSEGAGGGGISQTFSMPAYQQSLGTVSGSSGTPCGVSSGDCREIPDVSADADPSTGYVIYDSYNFTAQTSWTAMGGTSGAAPLWAAVLAVDASADGNTAGYGALNPALYLLAQRSAGTYLNDITSGNNDNNATDGGSYPAMTGYDMATGLGTPIASQLAIGLSAIPLNVVVSGSQSYGSSAPTFTGTANYAGSGSAPYGVTLRTSGLSCSEVDGSTPIGPTLSAGSHTIGASTCGGATLSGADATDYTIVYTSAANDFTVNPAPLTITASSPTSTYGSAPAVTPIYSGFKNADNATSLSVPPTCVTTATSSSPPSPPTYQSSCSGAADSNYTISYVSGVVTVDPAPLTITASSPTMIYGAAVPTITPIYSGFKNGDNASSLSVPPICVTTATSSSPPSPPTYQSSCSGAADSNYTISYAPGLVTVNPITVAVAVSGGQTYGSTTPSFSGTDNPPSGITVNTAGLTCSEVDSSTPIGPALLAGSRTVVASSCSGATLSGTGASDYIAAYTERGGRLHGQPGPADDHRVELDQHLRLHADRLAPLLGLRERRQRLVVECLAHVCHDRHPFEHSLTTDLSVLVLGRSGLELHHQLRAGRGDRHTGPADDHRLDRLHVVRRHASSHHPELLGLHERRHPALNECAAHVQHHGHQFEHSFAADLSVLVLRRLRRELRHHVRHRRSDRQPRPGLCRRVGQPDLREHHTQLLGDRQPTIGDQRGRVPAELLRGRRFVPPRPRASCGQPHPGHLRVQRRGPLGHRCGRLHHRLHQRRQRLHREPGPAHDHRLEPDQHVRLHAHDHAPLLGLRERRRRLVLECAAHVQHHGHRFEHSFTADLSVLVPGRRRLELHHQLRVGRRDRH